MGLGYIDEGVKALRVNNIIVSEATILNGSYPISRNLTMLTNGEPSGLVKAFIDFILSDAGQDIVAEEGFIRL
jgi:phosphate transport system substrate-binding protein